MADNENINYVPPDSFHEAVTFTSQPTPPYYYTDSWINNGFEYGCCHERSEGESFNADDWVSLGRYVPPTPQYITVTTRYEEYITDFSEESIAAYQESGAIPYAVYDDGTEVQVTWDQVSDPAIETEEFISDAEQLALANNQHFWSRDTATDGAGTGAFVTDEQQEAFLEAAAANFPNLGEAGKTDTWTGDGSATAFNLSEEAANTNYQVRVGNTGITTGITKTTTGFTLTTAPANGVTVYAYYTTTKKPWHNILMNVYGIAMRMGTKNLLALTKSAMAFYDGTGNEADNVTARFGSDGAQIGKSTENHTVIDARGISSYDGQGNLAPMRAAYFNELRADQLTAATAYIESLTADNITAANLIANVAKVSNLTAEQLSAATAYIGTLTTDQLTASNLVANVAKVANLTAEQLSAATAYIASLNANSITANQIAADHATVSSLDANYASISNLNVEKGRIDTLSANTADIATIRANAAKVANLTAQQLEADHATIGTLDTNYMHADMSNSDVAWIQNGTIKNGAISDAMINSVSANKLTAGTIDASNITVTNLNANNITTGTINGQRIGTGSLSLDKLSDDVYTESEVDGLLATMQSEIDGAIETWTGTAVPTLNNAPASGWSTNADKDKHVGDVYFVVNSQSQQNGYNYRFTKSGNTYSWALIKDTDITNALSRLSTAEGKITTFDSDITTLKTDTGTLKTKTQSLETSLGDKVDVTTFNGLEDTVDGHSQTISQHTTAISNKADNSTVTSVTNRVSKNEQDISGINTTISELSTTVESKADGSTVETVSNRLNTVSNTVDGHTSQLSSITSTQTTIQGSAVKSTVQLWFTKANTTAPNKPTAHVTTNDASTANAWNLAVPTYNASYPNYYYCYEYEYLNGTYGWSAVTRDIATGEMQERARTAITNAANAQDDIDGLEIGGRNLVIDSTNFRAGSVSNSSMMIQTVENGMYKMVISDGNTGSWNARWWPNKDSNWSNVENNLSEGDSFVISFEIRAVGSTKIPSIYIKPQMGYYNMKGNVSENWSTVYYTGTWKDAETINPHLGWAGISTASTYYIKSVKVEKGSKPSAWTPAPEDVDADISAAQTSANAAQATADKNLKESQQLWFTKANSTAPGKPTAKVTSTATTGNAWTTRVPTYNDSYKYYFYCMQYIAADGTVTWSDVIYDQATTEAQSVARAASADLTEFHQEYATFKQTTQQFESTVGETYATKTEMAEAAKQYDSDTEAPLVVGNNAATAPLRSYEGAGHAEQFTTTGKNLLDNDEYFPISGTSSNSYFREFNANSRGLPRIEVQAGVTYTLSFDVESSVTPFMISVGLGTGAYLTDVASSSISMQNGRNTITFTPTAEQIQQRGNVFAFRAPRYGSTKDFTYSVSNVQLEVGETATDYEPYTGGAPSPSPDYPQEIKVVRGRNLWDGAASITLSAAGHIVPITGFDAIADESYTFSFNATEFTPSQSTQVALYFRNSSDTELTHKTIVAHIGLNSITLVAPSGTTKIQVYANFACMVSNIQLELGSVATPYVPYGHVGMEAQGWNLFDPSHLLKASGWTVSNGVYTGSNAALHTLFIMGYPLPPLVNSRYTLSFDFDYDGDTATALDVVFRYTDGTKTENYINVKNSHQVFTSSAEKTLSAIGLTYGSTRVIRLSNIQLELGSVATAYEPYYHTTTAIPLPSRGWVAGTSDGTSDVLTLNSSGKVEWELPVGRESYSGTDIVNISGSRYGVPIKSARAYLGWITPKLCTIAPQIKVASNNGYVYFDDGLGEQLSTFTGDFDLYYPLATPITENCGYIDMPQVSEGCTISIPELEDSGISWWCKASESMANVTTAIEKRVTTAETSITQTKEQILLKANSSDVYTKTQTDGLIDTEVTNRNAAIQLASNAITSTVEKSYSKQQSRGIQLITNGNGFMGDNTNWSNLTFDDSKTNGSSPGSFTKSAGYAVILSDEFFPVDPSKEYLFEFDAMSADGTARLYSTLEMYDVDKKAISAQTVMYYPNTLTTLAADLNPGDTTVKLTSAANWVNASAAHERSLIFWDYTNAKGYTYPEETYSRNFYANIYADNNSVNKETGVITLKTAWTGPKKLAGTKVSQNHSGGGSVFATENAAVPNKWTHYKFVYSGIDTTKNGSDEINRTKLTGKFRQGTVLVKVAFLWNYGHSSSAPQGQLWVTNISVKENVATSTEVEAVNTVVQQTANNVLIKATQSDTTAAQGGQHLIQSLINVAPSGVKIDASKVNITGDAVFSAINNDTGTTKISGGKIDAASITLGQSQVKNYVSIRATTINYSANTATLEATLYVGGVAKTTGVTYVWMKDGTAISGETSRTYSVPASSGLNHAYSCKCTATV